MKVYRIKDGKDALAIERDGVDAREMIATGEYTDVNPNAPGEPEESAGTVMARTERLQKEDSTRAHFEQQASGNAMRSAREFDESNLVRRTEKQAEEARSAATNARRLADAASTIPSSNAALKLAADDAEKRADELEAKAKKEKEAAVKAQKAADDQREKEEKAADKKVAKAAPDKFDSMEKPDLKAYLDKKKVEYPSDARVDDLRELARAA